MKKNYPIILNVTGKKVTIVGGGRTAEQKVRGLLQTGANLNIISPNLTQQLQKWVDENLVNWKKKTFSPIDIKHSFIVIAATNDFEINQQVRHSTQPDQLVSLVDDPNHSDFILPSVFRRGKLMIAVSTSGASPILAKKIRNQLELTFDERYELYLEFLANARKTILQSISDPRIKQRLLTDIVDPSFLESDNREEMFRELLNQIQQEITLQE